MYVILQLLNNTTFGKLYIESLFLKNSLIFSDSLSFLESIKTNELQKSNSFTGSIEN